MSDGKHDKQAPPGTALPDEIYDGLFDRCEPKAAVANRRRHERKPWTTNLTVWVEGPPGAHVSARELEVTTHDISRGGVCFVHGQYLEPGTSVRLRFDSLPERPIVTGVVATCIYVGGKQHRVGVRFTSPASPA